MAVVSVAIFTAVIGAPSYATVSASTALQSAVSEQPMMDSPLTGLTETTTTTTVPTSTTTMTTTLPTATTTVPQTTTTLPAATTTTTSTTTTTTAPVALATSGVVTDGDSKANCIYLDAVNGVLTTAELSAVEQATGVTYDCIEQFADADPTWSNWVNPWPTGTVSDGWDAWLAASPNHQLVLGLNLVPNSVSPSGYPTNTVWEATCASGAYNEYAVALARNLVAAGAGNSVIRLGKEFNGSWENDYVGSPTDATYASELTNWIGCYRNEVTAMRSVPGAHFLFDWNPNTCITSIPLSESYPGDAYVDIIGADFYDADCTTDRSSDDEGWNRLYTLDSSIENSMSGMVAFARVHGKPLSIPEWGLEGKDDTSYMNGVIGIVRDNDVAYQSYFDCNCDNITPLGSQVPASTAAYRQAFG
jgi:hypothetical protein